MARLLVWLCGSVGLAYLAYRFAVWHLALQLAIVGMILLWVVLGGWLLGRRMRGTNSQPPTRDAILLSARAAHARQEYVNQFGEDSAAAVDKAEPGFWVRLAQGREVAK